MIGGGCMAVNVLINYQLWKFPGDLQRGLTREFVTNTQKSN